MSGQRPFDIVVFDLDGTLIDSAPDMTRALGHTLQHFGRRAVSEDEVRTMVGDGSANLVRQAFAVTGAPLADAAVFDAALSHYIDTYFDHESRPDSLYPGVAETLAALAADGVKMGLCTNKPERIARKVLGALGIGIYFPVVAGGDSLAVKKPDPAHLAHVIDGLAGAQGGDPVGGPVGGKAAMVGDNGNDVKAARGLGLPVVAVSYGYPRMPVAELGADIVIDHFKDLPAALRALAA